MRNWPALIVTIILLMSVVGRAWPIHPPTVPPLPAQATATRGLPPTSTAPPTYTRPPLPTDTPLPPGTAPPTAPPTTLPTAPPTAIPTAPAISMPSATPQPSAPPSALPTSGTNDFWPGLALGTAASLAAVALGIGLLKKWGQA